MKIFYFKYVFNDIFIYCRRVTAVLKRDNISHRGENLSQDISMTELSLWQNIYSACTILFSLLLHDISYLESRTEVTFITG